MWYNTLVVALGERTNAQNEFIQHNFLVAVLSSFELATTGILPPLTKPQGDCIPCCCGSCVPQLSSFIAQQVTSHSDTQAVASYTVGMLSYIHVSIVAGPATLPQ